MSDQPKIIIDEDWKSQVEAEKQAAEKQPAQSPPASDADDPPMPPASFELLLSSLVTEAMIALGQIPHPLTGQANVRRNQAKYFIDMIGVLQEKTKGNLPPGDEQALEDLLHQFRMAFVATAS